MCRSGMRVAGLRYARLLDVIGCGLDEPPGAHLEHVDLTSQSIQPAWLSGFPAHRRVKATN